MMQGAIDVPVVQLISPRLLARGRRYDVQVVKLGIQLYSSCSIYIKEETDWRTKPRIHPSNIRAKWVAGAFPSICMPGRIRKIPYRTCTNRVWMGK